MDDSNTGIIIGIIIFMILTIFFIVIFIGVGISDQQTNGQPILVQSGQFLSPCTVTSCNAGLSCDGNSFVCKSIVGIPCLDSTDCVTGLICSGLCATGATGGLNQLCPCNPGFVCTQQASELTICKGAGGTRCDLDSDCASDFCDGGICSTGAPNAFPCTTNVACSSQNCSNGFCQNPGIVTGTRGAACAGGCVGFTGAVCTSSASNPLSCECVNGTGLPGTCVTPTQGILSVCSNTSFCGSDLVCFGPSGMACGNGTGCFCAFPYNDPNSQATGSACINGMSATNQSCFNNKGLGCDSGSQCANRVCAGNSVLTFYRFSSTVSDLGTRFVGATNTAIIPGTTGPTFGPTGSSNLINPYKMFAISNGAVDTIYLVDHLQGLLSIQFNPSTQTVISPWIQLIPYQTTTTTGTTVDQKTLIDVGYNGTTFIVAFNETLTISGVPRQNDTVYSGSSPTNLIPFNVQTGTGLTGLPGTQYTTAGTPLSIDYIDISPPNDVSAGGDTLISINGTIYIRPKANPFYAIGIIQGGPLNGNQMTGLTGPARFYFDVIENTGRTGPAVCPENGGTSPVQCPSVDNVSFVGPFQSFGTSGNTGNYIDVLQFSGDIAGIGLPIDQFDGVQYEVFDYSIFSPTTGVTGQIGMRSAGIVILCQAVLNGSLIDTIVAASFGGSTTLFPYRVSTTSRSVATANAFYVISLGSCT